jgi:hypothetical protein
MRVNRNYIGPDLSTLTAAIAHSQILVTLAVPQRFLPVGYAFFPSATMTRTSPSFNGSQPRAATPSDPIFS